MFRLTIRELAARKLRLLTTAFAVLLGVAFMAGTMVFTDTIGASLDSALAEANEGVDAYVRTPSAIQIGYGEPGPRLDASLIDTVESVDGVDQAALRINGYAQLVGRDGNTVGDVSKSPAFGTNWTDVDELNPYDLASGRAPASADEIVIDKASADKAGYQPGDAATVLTQGSPRQFTIAGIATFGGEDSPAGATAVLFTDAPVDPYNGKCVRAGAGSLFHLPVATGVNVGDAVKRLRETGLRVLAADGAGEATLDDVDLTRPAAWIFGNEAWGLPGDILALADEVVRVPIYGRAESLNLATAAAVCLYASARAMRTSP